MKLFVLSNEIQNMHFCLSVVKNKLLNTILGKRVRKGERGRDKCRRTANAEYVELSVCILQGILRMSKKVRVKKRHFFLSCMAKRERERTCGKRGPSMIKRQLIPPAAAAGARPDSCYERPCKKGVSLKPGAVAYGELAVLDETDRNAKVSPLAIILLNNGYTSIFLLIEEWRDKYKAVP